MKYLFILISFIGFSQKKIKLINSDTKEKIPYVNIYRDNKLFITSDSLGCFYISQVDINNEYTAKCLGFITKKLNVQDSIIELKPFYFPIKEVIVRKNKNIIKLKQGDNKRGNIAIVCELEKKTPFIGKYFKFEKDQDLYLNKISFNTFCSLKSRKINILFYNCYENGEPKELISEKNIIINLKKGYNKNKINLKDYNIKYPEDGVLVVIEYLLLEENKKYGEKNPNWYFYEPAIDAEKTDEFKDCWIFYEDKWIKSTIYSLKMELELSN